ncbi:pYEATS domain-containing protein [Streptomyces inhibens]|uniref:pYEATS domain-containing protein n=1 Tax=Streptomyces inhibens TaxID=2293571 RepID=UPI001C6F5484
MPPPLAELTEAPTEAAPRVHLVHSAHRDSAIDRNGYRYFRLRIALEGDTESDLDRVIRVVYHPHPTFRDPDRVVTNRSTGFELTTAAWGGFQPDSRRPCEGQHRAHPAGAVPEFLTARPISTGAETVRSVSAHSHPLEATKGCPQTR